MRIPLGAWKITRIQSVLLLNVQHRAPEQHLTLKPILPLLHSALPAPSPGADLRARCQLSTVHCLPPLPVLALLRSAFFSSIRQLFRRAQTPSLKNFTAPYCTASRSPIWS